MQVKRELEWLYEFTGATIASCVGGMDIRNERRALERGAHIVVGTPGRLRDHLTRGALDLSALRAVVLDEADEMLDLGFREDLEFILEASPDDRRTLMFSATVPRSIADLARSYSAMPAASPRPPSRSSMSTSNIARSPSFPRPRERDHQRAALLRGAQHHRLLLDPRSGEPPDGTAP